MSLNARALAIYTMSKDRFGFVGWIHHSIDDEGDHYIEWICDDYKFRAGFSVAASDSDSGWNFIYMDNPRHLSAMGPLDDIKLAFTEILSHVRSCTNLFDPSDEDMDWAEMEAKRMDRQRYTEKDVRRD